MSNFVPFNREPSYLLPPDLKAWLPADGVAHFVVAAVDRAADAEDTDPQALPAELARREALKAKLDAAWRGWTPRRRQRPRQTARRRKPYHRVRSPNPGGS